MSIKDMIFNENSKKAVSVYTKMLKLLDSPRRAKINNPEKLLQGAGIMPGQTVLEIGCGSGFFTLTASKILGKEGKLYATDIHPIALSETQKKINANNIENVIVKKDDAMKSSFEDNMFDVVLLFGVVPAPIISMKDISKEIYRILKPGGIYAIWTVAPFWRPTRAYKSANFKKMKKLKSVFRLRKESHI